MSRYMAISMITDLVIFFLLLLSVLEIVISESGGSRSSYSKILESERKKDSVMMQMCTLMFRKSGQH
jgi:hypothetical protein